MSRRPQPSMRCVVRVAPQNCPEFQALCDSLQRNDPTVTTVTTDQSTTPEGYGHRLGEALLSNNNSIVTEIDLNLSFFLSLADRQDRTTNSATALLTWIEQSSSLWTVTLRTGHGSTVDRLDMFPPLLLQRLLDSMKQNPNIRAFHSYMHFPMPLLTEYLSSSNPAAMLQTLRIEIPNTTVRDGEQAALAIAALSGLQKLSLACRVAFLKLLPVHSTRLLRELNVDFWQWGPLEAQEVALFSSILSSSTNLKHVTIIQLLLDRGNWTLVHSGLQANPSITHLKLESCNIDQDTRSLIVNHIQSNNMTVHQKLHSLELSDLVVGLLSLDQDNGLSRLAQMICGSLLQHVTFDLHGMADHAVAEFFDVLSTNSSVARLQTMHLKGRLLWDMTAYLSSTIHLRHFIFTFHPLLNNYHEFSLPPTFLRSLRRNGSLHTVEFKNRHGQSYIPSDDVSLFIRACTTRNMELRNSMKSAFHAAAQTDDANESGTTRYNDELNTSPKKQFPALCQVSQQTERMAPNSVLQGLLASSDMLNTMSSSSRVLGKRVAAEALEDVSSHI